MSRIFEGLNIKILELGHVLAGPVATAMLADMGADVLKLEPISGENVRHYAPRLGSISTKIKANDGEANYFFEAYNRGKKGMALNLKSEEGQEILHKLLLEYDIFVSNYRLSVIQKLGLDYETLSKINPKLIHGILTAYGSRGPLKDEPGFDATAAWARGSGMYTSGEEGSAPIAARSGIYDRMTANNMVIGVLAAIIHRLKTDQGQAMEFSLYQTAVWIHGDDINVTLATDEFWGKGDRQKKATPLFNSYYDKEGRYFMIATTSHDRTWPNLCRAVSRPELENDLRFSTHEAREENVEALVSILDEVFSSKTFEEWQKIFKENNIVCGLAQTPIEVTKDEQAIVNDFFGTITHPVVGDIKTVNLPIRFRQNPAEIKGAGPDLGEHTEDILKHLGYDGEKIKVLRERNVI